MTLATWAARRYNALITAGPSAAAMGGMPRRTRAIAFCCLLALLVTACGQREKLQGDTPVEHTFADVSVHDPAIVKGEDGDWYIFGSHLAVDKTGDLMNWEYVNDGMKAHSKVIPNVYEVMADAFAWSRSDTFWAPDVIRLQDGKYHMYYCNCQGSEPQSCIGMAVSDTAAGPYENQGLFLYSGAGADEMNGFDSVYQPARDPNAVDPCVFYDPDGRLWMIYGSYSGGIFAKEMDPVTGMPLEMDGYGEKLLGGNHLRIEAPYVVYNPDTGYYYLFLSFGGLDSDGGYNVRVVRSENPDGPYYDSMGQEMTSCKGPSGSSFSDATAANYGVKLMGGYKFQWQEGELGENRKGFLSPGHNSCLYDEESGKYFMIHHTRFESRGEEHEVRVRQMFFNADGWPVLAPYRYAGETAGVVTAEEIPGTYKLVNHGRAITDEMSLSVNITLGKDGGISCKEDEDLSGTWALTGDSQAELTIDGRTYTGLFLVQWDEDGQKEVMTFTALDDETGMCVWGSGVKAR